MVEADYQTHHSADMDIRLNQHRDLQDDPYGQISQRQEGQALVIEYSVIE